MFSPSAPEQPVVTDVHITSCTVTYQPPRGDGGAPVTSYILERRTPGPDSEWIRVNNTPVTGLQYDVVNLTPDTEYEFRVAAVNMKGISDFSVMSPKIMTVEKPGKPGLPELIDVTGVSVRLQWTAPISGGTKITEYVVMVWTLDEKKDIPVPVDANTKRLISCTIRNQLKANTKYRFAVVAINRVGIGPWSDRTEEITTKAGISDVN